MAHRFCNFTPHAVHIYPLGKETAEPIVIPPCGVVPRLLSEPQRWMADIEGVPVFSPAKFTGIDTDPDLFEGYAKDRRTGLIFSRLVAQWLADSGFRWPGGVYNPDSGPESALRDESGRMVGTIRLEGPWC